jgi:hypothetical protein
MGDIPIDADLNCSDNPTKLMNIVMIISSFYRLMERAMSNQPNNFAAQTNSFYTITFTSNGGTRP